MMTKLSMFAASLVLVGGLFLAKMVIFPPTTEAAVNAVIDTLHISMNAPADLPSFDDRHQRHTGVLDILSDH